MTLTAQIQLEIRKAELSREIANDRLTLLRMQLKEAGCDHFKFEAYIWEHDNGYGRQHKRTGKRCTYCGWVDLWDRNHFINPAEITE